MPSDPGAVAREFFNCLDPEDGRSVSHGIRCMESRGHDARHPCNRLAILLSGQARETIEECAKIAEDADDGATRSDCGNDHGYGIANTIRALAPKEAR